MERIIVISDCHGRSDIIKNIILTEKEYKGNIIYLCAGDSEISKDNIYPFMSVKGNCDFFYNYPSYLIIPLKMHKILLTHGHLYSRLSLELMMEENKCNICITGHTHVPKEEFYEGKWYINPGSISRPRGNSRRQYKVIDIDDEGLIKISNKFIEEMRLI